MKKVKYLKRVNSALESISKPFQKQASKYPQRFETICKTRKLKKKLEVTLFGLESARFLVVVPDTRCRQFE